MIKARWNKHSSQHYHKMQENDRIKYRSDQYGTDKYWQRLQLELGPVNCQLRVSQNLGFEWLTGYWTSRLPCCALENLCETLSSKVYNLHQPASRLLVQDKRTWPLNWIVRSIIASIWFSESDIKKSSIIILILYTYTSYCPVCLIAEKDRQLVENDFLHKQVWILAQRQRWHRRSVDAFFLGKKSWPLKRWWRIDRKGHCKRW